jgi:hypothetical protein
LDSVAREADKPLDAAALREGRFDAQRTLWNESSLNSVRHCGRSLSKFSGDGKTVAVKMSEGKAGFAGLQSCGSPWACPVCSGKIAPVRATEIQSAIDAWHELGNRVVFNTFTMRHNSKEQLAELWDGNSHAWAKVTSGRAWERDSDQYGGEKIIRTRKRQKNGVKFTVSDPGRRINFIRAVEVTHGDNGWHVHIHALLFVKAGMTQKEATALGLSMFGRWRRALVNKGFAAPTEKHGVDAKLVAADGSVPLGKYFSKAIYGQAPKAPKIKSASWEVAGGMGKSGRRENRTPFQILADVVTLGDESDLKRWFVYEQASKGRRQITWSHGFRALLNLQPEKTDEEIAAEKLKGAVVMEFDLAEWRRVQWHKGRVLQLVETGCSKDQVLKIILEPERLPAVA